MPTETSKIDEVIEESTESVEAKTPDAVEETIDFVGFADELPEVEGEPEEGAESSDPFKGQPAPEWVRQTREENRELKRRLRELEAAKPQETAPTVPDLGPKPTLASADYDEDVLQQRLDDWYATKAKVSEAQAKQQAEQLQQQERWNTKLQSYNQNKAALARDDYEEAEAAVQDALSQSQIGVLLAGVKEPAAIVYALGKSPAKLAALKNLDPVETAFALARLENQVQIKKSPKVTGESPAQGTASGTVGSTSARLAQLEAEANRTGNRSKLMAYKEEQRRLARNK